MTETTESRSRESLGKLFNERIAFAGRHANWYRQKKRSRQRLSQSIRLTAIIFLVAGGIWPQIVAIDKNVPQQAGYILLALSAGLFLVDRVFGASSNWQRYIVAALEIEAKREVFAIRWSELQATESSHNALVQKSFALALDFTQEVDHIVLDETNRWAAAINQEIKQLPTMR